MFFVSDTESFEKFSVCFIGLFYILNVIPSCFMQVLLKWFCWFFVIISLINKISIMFFNGILVYFEDKYNKKMIWLVFLIIALLNSVSATVFVMKWSMVVPVFHRVLVGLFIIGIILWEIAWFKNVSTVLFVSKPETLIFKSPTSIIF